MRACLEGVPMRVLGTLLMIAVLGFGYLWYRSGERDPRHVNWGRQAQREEQRAANAIHQDKGKLPDVHLDSDRIREELARTGRVVRQKAGVVATKVADAT